MSVLLAQGAIESAKMTSMLAVRANNLFGIKCHAGGKKKVDVKKCNCSNSVSLNDDDPEDRFYIFRNKYESMKFNYSKTRFGSRYKKCVTKAKKYPKAKDNITNIKTVDDLAKHDVGVFCTCLKEQGYATEKKYAKILMKSILNEGFLKYEQ